MANKTKKNYLDIPLQVRKWLYDNSNLVDIKDRKINLVPIKDKNDKTGLTDIKDRKPNLVSIKDKNDKANLVSIKDKNDKTKKPKGR